MRSLILCALLVLAAAHMEPVRCPSPSPRTFQLTGCMSKDVCRKRRDVRRGGSAVRGWKTVCEEDIVCPPIDERPSPFDEFPEVDYEVVEARARWALEGRPGTGCCVDKDDEVLCATTSLGVVGQDNHLAARADVMGVIASGTDGAWEWLANLRNQGDDRARKVLRKINDYDLATIAYLVSQHGDGFLDGVSHEEGGSAFLFVLTSKLTNLDQALAGHPTPRDAGKIDAIVGKLGGFGYIFQLFPTLTRAIRGRGGAGSPTLKLPRKAQAEFEKLLQVEPHSGRQPTFLPQDRHFVPGDWKAYNAYADSVTRSTMRHGQAIPLFNGGYVPEKGRPVPRSELLDEPNGDLLAREIFPGEKLKLEDVTACFPRAIMDIKECQPDDPVYLSVYVYQSDEWARIFTDVLIDARQRGCDVQVIYDAVGSGLSDHAVDDEGEVTQLPSSDKYYDKMRRHGIPVVEWPTESYRSDKISSHLNHRKILIVGGGPNRKRPAVAYNFLNVGTEYAALWTDFSWRLQGPATVDLMRLWEEQKNRVFYRLHPSDFHKFDGQNPTTRFETVHNIKAWKAGVLADWQENQPTEFVYKTIRVVGHIGLEDIDIKSINIAAMKTAVNRIKVQCPYTTDRDFLETLRDSGKRFRDAGKEGSVVLLVPANNDMGMTKLCLRTWYRELLENGVVIREGTSSMEHGKAKLFDDIVEGGSSNLDTRSLWNNDEQITAVMDKTLADSIDAKVFHNDADRIITLADVRRYEEDTKDWLISKGYRKIWMQL